jgi:hypothetical protein
VDQFTQIANLLLLAPNIQEAILNYPPVPKGPDPITEHHLREIVASLNWVEQRISWQGIETLSRPPAAACGSRAVP